jgi:hypothetical protein
MVDRLGAELGDRLELVFLMPDELSNAWATQAAAFRASRRDEVFPLRVGLAERVRRRLDRRLDSWIGFYPLAIRLNLRHGFHRERMEPGHRNRFLDPTAAGPLPRWRWLEATMRTWLYGRLRYVPSALRARLHAEHPALVLSNLQVEAVVPMIAAARRLRLPLVGYVSSWDHTVGKGAVYAGMDSYLVQNDVMRDDLIRYHGIDPDRVVVTGWPQTDVFHRRRPRADYEALLAGCGLDPSRPLVMVMGNTPTNAPYEARFVERLVGWWEESGARDRFSLLFRPHPRDGRYEERFAAARDRSGVYLQAPSYTDIETLTVLLQHGDCVVTNAGTILLDSLVNDRPAVCVLYDEGAPPGESWAAKNVTGEHYRQLMESEAFHRARSFEQVIAGIERSLERPDELSAERARVAREVVGEVDGAAADRVVAAILATVERVRPAVREPA